MSNTQEEYLQSLKRIKEVEDKVQLEIETHRKLIEEKINTLQKDLEDSFATSKDQGETLVEKSIQESRFDASKEADKIMEEAEKKAQHISIQLDPQTIEKIIEIFLSGM
jgi:vacuolar-type H+-ATPase subunit H